MATIDLCSQTSRNHKVNDSMMSTKSAFSHSDISPFEIEMSERLKKIHDIYKVLTPQKYKKGSDDKINISILRSLCKTKHGLVNEEIRRKVWPLLLNVDLSLRDDTSWTKYAKQKHGDSDQIAKDINRSLNTFDTCKKMSKTIK